MVDRFSISWYNKLIMAESFKQERPNEEDSPTPFIDYIEQLGEKNPDGKKDAKKETIMKTEQDSNSFIDLVERMGEEAPAKEKRAGEKRREWAAGAAIGTSAAVVGLGITGGLWTIEQALKYALLGWKIDDKGWPRVDKESLAHFDKWYRRAAGQKAA